MAIAQLVPAPAAVAIYARISDDRQDGAGVERQLQDCQALVKRRGWGSALEFIDNSKSAYSGKIRPRYTELLAAVRAGEVGRIVVWHIDRLYRQPRELEDVIDLADEGRVEVATVNAGDLNLSNDNGITMARVAVAFANQESRDKGRRIRSQKKQARELGVMSGGPRPFGWKAVPLLSKTGQPLLKDDGTPRMTWRPDELDKVEAGLIRRAVDSVFAGVSLAEIARQWNDKGVPQPQTGGSRWTAQLVRQVLTNGRVGGMVTFRDEVQRDGTWPAILEKATWERCRAVLDSRATNVGIPKRRTLLTKLVVCGRCGTPMVQATNGNTRTGYRKVWRCPSSNLPGRESKTKARPCGGVSIAAQQLEDHITAAVFEYADTADLAAQVAARNAPDHEAADLIKELAALDRRSDEAAASHAKGKIPTRVFEKHVSLIEAERASLNARLARVSQPFVLGAYAGRRGLLRRQWSQLSLEQQRAVIREAFGRIVIAPSVVRGLPHFDHRRVTLGPSVKQ